MGVFGSWVLAHGKVARYATLTTASATAGDMPLSYLITSDQPTDRVRFTDPTNISFDIDITTSMAAQGLGTWRILALLYNNSSSLGTFTVTGAATAAGIGSPTYNSGPRSLWPSTDCHWWPRIHSKIWEPAGRTEKYLRVTINESFPRKPDPDAPGGFAVASYFDIGNLIIGPGYTTGDSGGDGGVLYSSPIDGLNQEPRRVIAEGGPKFPRARPVEHYKSFELTFTGPNARVEYYGRMAELRRYVGAHRGVLLCEDLLGSTFQMDHTTFGLMTINDVSIPSNDWFHVLVRIEELI